MNTNLMFRTADYIEAHPTQLSFGCWLQDLNGTPRGCVSGIATMLAHSQESMGYVKTLVGMRQGMADLRLSEAEANLMFGDGKWWLNAAFNLGLADRSAYRMVRCCEQCEPVMMDVCTAQQVILSSVSVDWVPTILRAVANGRINLDATATINRTWAETAVMAQSPTTEQFAIAGA